MEIELGEPLNTTAALEFLSARLKAIPSLQEIVVHAIEYQVRSHDLKKAMLELGWIIQGEDPIRPRSGADQDWESIDWESRPERPERKEERAGEAWYRAHDFIKNLYYSGCLSWGSASLGLFMILENNRKLYSQMLTPCQSGVEISRIEDVADLMRESCRMSSESVSVAQRFPLRTITK